MGRELTCFKVELQQRDRQIPNNTDEVSLYPCKCPKSPPTLSHTPTQPNSSSPSPASTKPSQPSNSQNEAETPAASRNTETPQKNTTATTPAEKQPVKTEADIAILMDSNGKFLQGEKLFPGRKTTELWCPKTGDALRILSDSSFGTPSHIIIHTGTNDLRREQEKVGQLINRVAEKATETYPNTKITIFSYPAETFTQTPSRESTLTSPKDLLTCPMCIWLITPPSQSESCMTMYT